MSDIIYLILALPFIAGACPIVCALVWTLAQWIGFEFSYIMGMKIWAALVLAVLAIVIFIRRAK